MTTKLLKPVSLNREVHDQKLFSGFWLRWSALTESERTVCGIIILMPLWWALGIIPYLLSFIGVSIALYEWGRYRKLRLKPPSLVVITLFVYYTYGFLNSFLLYFDAHPLAALPLDAVRKPIDLFETALSTFLTPYLFWYIQSNKVRVRLEVVAWAFSISVIQMLAVWSVVHFVFAEAYYNPPRTLWGILTGKATEYERGTTDSNYLLLYLPLDRAFGGLPRFYSFFHRPESFALFVGVVGILALDIKNRIWSLLLFVASVFLLGLSGTRTVWIAFPCVLLVRSLLTTRKVGGSQLLFALIATASFFILSFPPVTDVIFNAYSNTATSISQFRENSTDVRGQVYQGTWERIIDNPINFTFGHVVSGPVVPGTEIEIGSHSHFLGLLYKGGFISTGLFMAFWISLFVGLYRTRIGRPACSFLIWLLISITLATMLLSPVAQMAILLTMMLHKSEIKLLRRNGFLYA